MWEYFVIIFLGLWIWDYFSSTTKLELNGRHIFITGGSSGIGFSIAKQVVMNGGKVTLIARNLKKLENAKTKLVNLCKVERVNIQSVDITQNQDILSASVTEAERLHGPIYMLVNCAGFAIPAELDRLDRFQLKSMFEVNFFASYFLTQIVTKNMKQNEVHGKIVFVSSAAGLFGFYGLSAYAASKAAVNKAAEALHQELKPFGISVTVALPPDTDTPGFKEEQKTKPIECQNISDGGGLYQPDDVANSILLDVFNRKFYSSIGFNGFILTNLCADMTPVSSVFELFCQVIFGGLFRLISVIYLFMWDRMIQKEHKKKSKQ